MDGASFTLALDPVGALVAPPSRLRRARERAWKVVTARLAASLDAGERAGLRPFTVEGDATRLTVRWEARAGDPDPTHVLALAAAMEAPALAKALAPVGLRVRDAPTVFSLLEPASAVDPCGLCRTARGAPLRWEAARPEALAALRSLTVDALRAAPDAVAATLMTLLAAPEQELALAAVDALARLVGRARGAERVVLGPAVAAAWGHPDETVARAAFRCAAALGAEAPRAVIDAWGAAVARFREDASALIALGAFCHVAGRSDALAAALPAWLRARSPVARRVACGCLERLLKAPQARWPPGHEAAFAALTAAAVERVEEEYVPLLLRYLDRRPNESGPAVVAWLDASDFHVFSVGRPLLAQQPTHPELDAAAVRALRHPDREQRHYAFAWGCWNAYREERLARTAGVLFTAAAETAGTPIGDELRGRLGEVMIRNLDAEHPETGARLVAAALGPGAPAEHLDAIADRLLEAWRSALRDERLRVVAGFVAHGHVAVLQRAFERFAARRAHEQEGALVARLALGLSWSMQRAGAWAEGGAVAGLAAGLAPPTSRPDLLYNQACGAARVGDAEGAARALAEAIALEASQADDARADEDFTAVRAHPAMVALLGPAP